MSILASFQSAALPTSPSKASLTLKQASSDPPAPIPARLIYHHDVKRLNSNMGPDSSRSVVNKRAFTPAGNLSIIAPLSIEVPETDTLVIMMEEIDPERTNYMPKVDFERQMNRFIAGIEYGIRTEGADTIWGYDEDVAHLGRFLLSIVGGSGGRRPTFGDLRSAGIVLRDNIEHFSVSSRSYKEVQLHVVRIGTSRDLPLAVIDVYKGDSVSSGPLTLFNGTSAGSQQACQSVGCPNLVATAKWCDLCVNTAGSCFLLFICTSSASLIARNIYLGLRSATACHNNFICSAIFTASSVDASFSIAGVNGAFTKTWSGFRRSGCEAAMIG